MTYSQPPYGYPQPAPRRSEARRVLGMSVGVFVGILAAVVVLCGAGITAVALLATLGSVGDAASAPSAEIVSCDIQDDPFDVAIAEWDVTNNRSRERRWDVDLNVYDQNGDLVGASSVYIDVPPGETYRGDTTILLDSEGGQRCEILLDFERDPD